VRLGVEEGVPVLVLPLEPCGHEFDMFGLYVYRLMLGQPIKNIGQLDAFVAPLLAELLAVLKQGNNFCEVRLGLLKFRESLFDIPRPPTVQTVLIKDARNPVGARDD
jgi:hypothetical protein